MILPFMDSLFLSVSCSELLIIIIIIGFWGCFVFVFLPFPSLGLQRCNLYDEI